MFCRESCEAFQRGDECDEQGDDDTDKEEKKVDYFYFFAASHLLTCSLALTVY